MSPSLATIRVLWQRDLVRFVRQRSRVAGALGQPLLVWLLLGTGLAGSFVVPGAEDVDYSEYLFPGVVSLVVLFSAVFSTMSVIEDRAEGFLQVVLVAPGSRFSLVLGKALGGASVALLHGLLLMLLAPLAGYDLTAVDWPALVGILGLGALGLCGLGFAAAWWIDSVAGYHGVMGAVFFPLWALSGAMFPPATAGAVLETAARFDPLSYVGEGVRRALYGGELPAASIGMPGSTVATEFLVVAGFAAASLMLAAAVSRRN